MKVSSIWFMMYAATLSYTSTSYGDDFFRLHNKFLDSLLTQINLGYTQFNAVDRAQNAVVSNNFNFLHSSGEGLHGGMNIRDEIRVYRNWYVGARVGGQFWSALNDNTSIPSSNNYTSFYNYQKFYGVFFDATLNLEFIPNKFDIYSFVGVSYNRYGLQGTNVFQNGVEVTFRDSKSWSTSPRAGLGISHRFNNFYSIGLEYAHMFRNTAEFYRTGFNLSTDSRNHLIKFDDDTIDLTVAVYMNP